MGLGTNNRDYKTSDRAARINLAAHKILTDKHSLKLGGVQSDSPCGECGHESHGIVCPKCTCMFQVKKAAQASWREFIEKTDTDEPTSANCVLCDEPVWEVADLREFEKNGAHVKCAEKELTGEVISLCQCAVRRHSLAICPRCEQLERCDACEHFHEMNQTCGKCGREK